MRPDLGEHHNVVAQPHFFNLFAFRTRVAWPKRGGSGRKGLRLPRRGELFILRKRKVLKPL